MICGSDCIVGPFFVPSALNPLAGEFKELAVITKMSLDGHLRVYEDKPTENKFNFYVYREGDIMLWTGRNLLLPILWYNISYTKPPERQYFVLGPPAPQMGWKSASATCYIYDLGAKCAIPLMCIPLYVCSFMEAGQHNCPALRSD